VKKRVSGSSASAYAMPSGNGPVGEPNMKVGMEVLGTSTEYLDRSGIVTMGLMT